MDLIHSAPAAMPITEQTSANHNPNDAMFTPLGSNRYVISD
jgi:hypothetical protein